MEAIQDFQAEREILETGDINILGVVIKEADTKVNRIQRIRIPDQRIFDSMDSLDEIKALIVTKVMDLTKRLKRFEVSAPKTSTSYYSNKWVQIQDQVCNEHLSFHNNDSYY